MPATAVPATAVPATTALAGASSAPSVGGWGRGGYPMVTGPASGVGSNGVGSNGEPGNAPDGGTANVTDVASENWAGYAATGTAGSLTSVSSSWAQPAVTCGATDTFSSFWVGLDGDGTPTVEQTGTEADCAGGVASYQGWYEIFPNAPVFFSNPVQPGDAMSASVVSDGGGTFTLTLTDSTQGWTQTTQQAEPDAQLGSAEVIAEAPSNGTVLPLADFGTVNFTNATVDDASIGDSAQPERTHDGVRFRRGPGHPIGADRRQRLLRHVGQRRHCHHSARRRSGWWRPWSAPPRLGVLGAVKLA